MQDPVGFTAKAVSFLGVEATKYVVAEISEDMKIQLGLDPRLVGWEMEANRWINENGGNVDLGIQLSILKNESAGGLNIGGCQDGLAAAKAFSAYDEAAAKWLLDRWKTFGVRSPGISEDWSNYQAHCSAGEMGANAILPRTGRSICENGLSKNPDPEIASCNFFNPRVAAFAKVWWLNAIGYKADAGSLDMLKSLKGWNQSVTFRTKLIAEANAINALTDWGAVKFSESQDLAVLPKGTFQRIGIAYLQFLGILPEKIYASSPEFIGTSSDWLLCPLASCPSPSSSGHKGTALDFSCNLGDPVVAVANGQIVVPNRLGWRYDPYGWGNSVWIDHGNGLFTHYAHLLEPSTVSGEVSMGDQIGVCGSTGRSTGAHVHFEVLRMHPDMMKTWDDPEAYLDPSLFLGQQATTTRDE